MVKGCERFRYIVKQWEREWRDSQDGSLLPKPGDYQAMNTAEKAGAGPATSWPPSPYPRAAREGVGVGGGGFWKLNTSNHGFVKFQNTPSA